MTIVSFVSADRLARWRSTPHALRIGRCATCIAQSPATDATSPGDEYEMFASSLTASGRFRVLRRLTPRSTYDDPAGSQTHVALYIDVETTGLDHATDRIIQLAITSFTFTADGRVCAVRPSESWYEDPGVPISDEITRLTGIRRADVAGKRIDDERVNALLAEAVLVIAHNAAFDRPFLEPRFPGFAERPWGCSMADVPWIAEGLPTTKLEWLAERHAGVFYEAHRADVDTLAGVHLLASALPSGDRAMSTLLEGVRRRTARVWALGAPFATKDRLKARGYRWSGGEDGKPKAWWRDVAEDALSEERRWLATEVYRGEPTSARMQRLSPKVRYSARIAQVPMRTVDGRT